MQKKKPSKIYIRGVVTTVTRVLGLLGINLVRGSAKAGGHFRLMIDQILREQGGCYSPRLEGLAARVKQCGSDQSRMRSAARRS